MSNERETGQTDSEETSSQLSPQPDTLPMSGLPDMDDSEIGHIGRSDASGSNDGYGADGPSLS